MKHQNKIVILDFGSQYTKLIARRIRELSVFSEIRPHQEALAAVADPAVRGMILSGGPDSVLSQDSPKLDLRFWDTEIPVLGICYGLQLMCRDLGGVVEPARGREYGPATLELTDSHPLFEGWSTQTKVWMSHGDRLLEAPTGFQVVGASDNAAVTAMVHERKPWFGLQFHPEVSHTEGGRKLLANFVFGVCSCPKDWNMGDFIEETVSDIRRQVGAERVLLGLSGGVDSSVAAALIHRAIGSRLTCVFVDHGLMRKNESAEVIGTFRERFGSQLRAVDASGIFLQRLAGVADPEAKRKIIGKAFIEVFEAEAGQLDSPKFLAQGTLYPDVIESACSGGPAQTIKSHHNVGGLPETMNLELLEPLRELFKDEVRQVGRLLGLPETIVNRHPFPGPGLAIRVMGPVTPEDLDCLREADAIFIEMLHRHGLYDRVSQAFAVLLPIQTVGIMGDERTYEKLCALRAVTSADFMTADWARLPPQFLAEVSARIVNEVKGINRVVFDITSKPPGTIEWE